MTAKTPTAARPARPVRFFGATLLIGCALLCAACAGMLSPGPPPVRLQLHPALPRALAAKPLDKQLVIAMPTAGRELEGDAIALIFHGREVRYLAGARWTGALPLLLQRQFVEAFEASGLLAGVSDDVTGMVANARLLSDIKMFGLEYASEDSPPTARFAANFRLLNLYTGKILAARTIETQSPAPGKDAVALAGACERALEQALAELTAWTGEEMRRMK